jgi:heme/copper-type cytochrome/quinol oxidase subunit 3
MNPFPAGETETMLALAVVKTLVLVVGSVITYFAFKAYRRTRQPALGYLAAGFGIVTLGLVLAGMLYEVLEVDLAMGILLESLLVLVGFLVIAYSLYVQ